MSLPFFHKDHTDISNHLDFPSELLNLPASSENCLLIIGPDLVKCKAASDQGHTYTYLERLLEEMVEWCTQKKVIQEQNIVHDLHTLLHNGALVPLGYRIEEYLAVRQLKEQCLRMVLFPHNQVRKIHRDLARILHRGYITTGYDTCIETAYAEIWHNKLSKFYLSSLAQAVDASRKKQPFILKLYGDLDEPDSIKLGHRLLTGLYAEDVREQLRQLFSETPAIIIGFDEADGDLAVLQSLVKDGYIAHQKHSTRLRERLDGIITKPGDQSASDYLAHEFSPGDHTPGPVISSQSKDVASKDEPLEGKPPPDTILPESVSVPNSKAIANDSEGNHKYESPPQSPPPGSGDGHSGQIPTSSFHPSQVLASPLPDDLFNNFISLLRHIGYKVEEKEWRGPRGVRSYTRVENKQRNDFRALIYIPGAILTDPDSKSPNSDAVINLWYDFIKLPLIIFTDSKYCNPVLQDAVETAWPIKGRIVFWHQIEDLKVDDKLEDHKYWITEKILGMDV